MQEPGTLNDGPGFLLNVVFKRWSDLWKKALKHNQIHNST